jgi:hypothetical protein
LVAPQPVSKNETEQIYMRTTRLPHDYGTSIAKTWRCLSKSKRIFLTLFASTVLIIAPLYVAKADILGWTYFQSFAAKYGAVRSVYTLYPAAVGVWDRQWQGSTGGGYLAGGSSKWRLNWVKDFDRPSINVGYTFREKWGPDIYRYNAGLWVPEAGPWQFPNTNRMRQTYAVVGYQFRHYDANVGNYWCSNIFWHYTREGVHSIITAPCSDYTNWD